MPFPKSKHPLPINFGCTQRIIQNEVYPNSYNNLKPHLSLNVVRGGSEVHLLVVRLNCSTIEPVSVPPIRMKESLYPTMQWRLLALAIATKGRQLLELPSKYSVVLGELPPPLLRPQKREMRYSVKFRDRFY